VILIDVKAFQMNKTSRAYVCKCVCVCMCACVWCVCVWTLTCSKMSYQVGWPTSGFADDVTIFRVGRHRFTSARRTAAGELIALHQRTCGLVQRAVYRHINRNACNNSCRLPDDRWTAVVDWWHHESRQRIQPVPQRALVEYGASYEWLQYVTQ